MKMEEMQNIIKGVLEKHVSLNKNELILKAMTNRYFIKRKEVEEAIENLIKFKEVKIEDNKYMLI